MSTPYALQERSSDRPGVRAGGGDDRFPIAALSAAESAMAAMSAWEAAPRGDLPAPTLIADRDVLPPFASEQAVVAWSKPLPSTISTGMRQVDDLLGGGVEAGSIYGLCAGTGMGKTGLAVLWARNMARRYSVVYFTSELPERQVLARFAAQVLNKAWRELNRLTPEVGVKLVSQALEGLRLRVIEIRRDTDIVRVLDQTAAVDGEAPVFFVDYLQHAARRGNPDDRRLAVAALSDTLTGWARDTKSSGIVVSSTARTQYTSDENRLASTFVGTAKESGDVDYDAAAIMFLDTVLDGVAPGATTTARIHIAKSRFGVAGTVGLTFDGAIGLFTADPTGALTSGQQEVVDSIREGATNAGDVARGVGRRRADILATIAVLRTRGVIGIRPLRVLQPVPSFGSRSVPTDGDDFGDFGSPGTRNFTVPAGSRKPISDGELGSEPGNPPSGGTLGSHPEGVEREPKAEEGAL